MKALGKGTRDKAQGKAQGTRYNGRKGRIKKKMEDKLMCGYFNLLIIVDKIFLICSASSKRKILSSSNFLLS